MRKRQKFVLTAVALSIGVWFVQSASLDWKYGLIALLVILNWVLAVWSLREGLSGVEWLTVTIPPPLFTVGVGLFYILLPQTLWAKILIVGLFGVGQYALLLTANIFSVAAIRTIALLRAAHAVSFVMALLTGFFLYNTILSFRFGFWWVGLAVAVASAFLLLPGLWAVDLPEKLTRRIWLFSLVLAVWSGVLAMAICFWPVSTAVGSLFLTTVLYVFLGLAQHYFSQRLFAKTIWEYVTVGVVVLITMLTTSSWGV